MNFFSHAYRFVGQEAYFLAGLAVPDWLGMIDRRVRVRRERVEPFCDHADLATRLIARGILQHFVDDRWFHESQAFAELHLSFTREISERLDRETRFRPYFVAHIAIEMLLDAALTEVDPGRLDQYYGQIQRLDPRHVQRIVNQMAGRPTVKLAEFIPHFLREGFLYDYARNDRLVYRVNRILRALNAPPLPRPLEAWAGDARQSVRRSMWRLLQPPLGEAPFQIVPRPEGAINAGARSRDPSLPLRTTDRR